MPAYIAFRAEKIKMTSLWIDEKPIPVTMLYVPKHYVCGIKTIEKHGYNAILIGTHETKVKKINKPQAKFYEKNNLPHLKHLKEFRIKSNVNLSGVKIGDEVLSDLNLLSNTKVDIHGISQGKGFQGGMKKHGFKGMPATHGVSLTHRSLGATGSRQDPGKVFKGKKMAGHMGDEMKCMHNLQIIKILEDRIIAVIGSVPGAYGTHLYIKSAVKSLLPNYTAFNNISLSLSA